VQLTIVDSGKRDPLESLAFSWRKLQRVLEGRAVSGTTVCCVCASSIDEGQVIRVSRSHRVNLDNPLTLIRPRVLRDAGIDKLRSLRSNVRFSSRRLSARGPEPKYESTSRGERPLPVEENNCILDQFLFAKRTENCSELPPSGLRVRPP
jgi:hypothetical protein